MKRLFFGLQFPLFIAFNFFAFVTLVEVTSKTSGNNNNNSSHVYNGVEEFDPLLKRISNTKKLEEYCDSLYAVMSATGKNVRFEETFPSLVTSVIRKRFYHGYSNFDLNNNFAAVMFEPLTGNNASAIVLPDDILKFPYAACSQQSIVVLNLLKKKGFLTRVVGLTGKTTGHFCFETFYNGSWHFFDPNKEPDESVLNKYNRPSIAFLANNPSILVAAYHHLPKDYVLDLFTNYTYGKPNATLAPWATFYQKVTSFLSYTLWIFFLMTFIWVRRKYLRLKSSYNVRNRRIYLPQLQPGSAPSYHVGY